MSDKEHDWYDTFGDTRCRDCDVLAWDPAANTPCPGDTIGPNKPPYWYDKDGHRYNAHSRKRELEQLDKLSRMSQEYEGKYR